MKRTLLLFALILAPFFAFSQQYEKRRNYLNGGVGFGNYSDRSGLPIWLNYEYGFGSWFSAGAMLAYQTWDYKITGVGTYSYTATFFAVRGSAHFSEPLKIDDVVDLYAGLGIGYINYTDKWTSSSGQTVRPSGFDYASSFLGAHVGARRYFSKNLGVNLELGYGLSPLLLGLAFKF